MTREEARVKCIEAIGITLFREFQIAGFKREYYINKARAAFDALHGIVRVNPVDATEEMVAVALNRDRDLDGNKFFIPVFNAMSAAGDITNAPEIKP